MTAVGFVALAAGLGAWTAPRIERLTTPPLPPSLVAALRTVPGCTTADRATTLVLAGEVDRQLERGCALWPDVTGWQFAAGRIGGSSPLAQDDAAYQRRALAYFRSGDAVVLLMEKDGLAAATRRAVLAGPMIWSGEQGGLHGIDHPHRTERIPPLAPSRSPQPPGTASAR